MRTSNFLFSLAFMLLSALAAHAQKFPLPTAIVPDGLGYNIHFTDAKQGEMKMLAESGVTFVRMDFFWDKTEPQKGVYDFSAYDRLADTLKKYNIRPLFIFDYSNRNYDEGLAPYSPEGRAAFATWAAKAAVHFKEHSILWEMYNEPNGGFWRPKENPANYVLLALAVGRALREAAPNEIYIGPATSGIDFNFIEKCFKAGLLEYWDAVSVHPYRQQSPETVIPDYTKLRNLIDQYAPKDKHIPILSGEWGYSSIWENFNDDVQGKFLPRQWLINLSCNIPVSIWYDWHNDGADPKEPEHHFGITQFEYHQGRTPVYNPKPSYHAAQTFTKTFRDFKFNARLLENQKEIYVFLFKKNKELRLAAWTTKKEPQTITIPCSKGTFEIISHLGEKLPDLKAGTKGLTLTVTDAPVYLIPKTTNKILLESLR